MLPRYLPYLDVFLSVTVPTKKPVKKPVKQALKSMLTILILLAAPPAGSTCSISNTYTHLHTANIAPMASTVNKYRKLFAPPPLGPLKPGQRAKLIKVTWITYIDPPIGRN